MSSSTADSRPQGSIASKLAKICDHFLPGRQPTDVRDAARIAAEVLEPDELNTIMSCLYEMVGDIREKCNELAAWLLNFEVERDCWKRSGYSSYKEYLCSIDTSVRLRRMINAHTKTVARRNRAGQNISEYWPDSPELCELLNRKDGEEKWLRLSHLARLTKSQPDLAKECLNRAYSERLMKQNRKWRDTRWFISADFRRAQKLADQMDVVLTTVRPRFAPRFAKTPHQNFRRN